MKWDVWKRFSEFSKEGQVFRIQRYSTRYRGDRLVPEQCSGIFKRTTAKYKMEVSPHKIRHLVATILANLSPRRSRTSTTSPLRWWRSGTSWVIVTSR